MSIVFAGLAKTAYDEAFNYAQNRMQRGEPPSGAHAVAARCLSTETATYVASKAIQIFDGNGLAKEYPVEKMCRDSRAAMIEDGVNMTFGLAAAEFL